MQLLSNKQEHRYGSEKSLEDEAQDSEPVQAVIEPEVEEAQIEASAEILKKSLASTPPPSPAAGKVEEGMEKGKKYFNCKSLSRGHLELFRVMSLLLVIVSPFSISKGATWNYSFFLYFVNSKI